MHISDIDHALRQVKEEQQQRRDRGLDMIVDRESFLDITDSEVFGVLDRAFPERKLYSQSTDWRKDSCFILKAKGSCGDVVVGWKGTHDKGGMLNR